VSQSPPRQGIKPVSGHLLSTAKQVL
jgi:hypothetical protein